MHKGSRTINQDSGSHQYSKMERPSQHARQRKGEGRKKHLACPKAFTKQGNLVLSGLGLISIITSNPIHSSLQPTPTSNPLFISLFLVCIYYVLKSLKDASILFNLTSLNGNLSSAAGIQCHEPVYDKKLYDAVTDIL